MLYLRATFDSVTVSVDSLFDSCRLSDTSARRLGVVAGSVRAGCCADVRECSLAQDATIDNLERSYTHVGAVALDEPVGAATAYVLERMPGVTPNGSHILRPLRVVHRTEVQSRSASGFLRPLRVDHRTEIESRSDSRFVGRRSTQQGHINPD